MDSNTPTGSDDEEIIDFPATTKLKCLYDYQYKDDYGVLISMNAGEEYYLLQKSGDWWEVIRSAEDSTDLSFYVPANYVEECLDESQAGDDKAGALTDSAETNPGSDLNTQNSDSHASSQDVDQAITETQSPKTMELYMNDSELRQAINEKQTSSFKPNNSKEHNIQVRPGFIRRSISDDGAGEYANLDQYRKNIGIAKISPTEPPPDYDFDLYANIGPNHQPQASLDTIYANLEDLQQHTAPEEVPFAENGIFKKTIHGVWDAYALPNIPNRLYYIHRDTKERTWKPKPPRHSDKKRMAPPPPGLDQKVDINKPVIPSVRVNRSSSDFPGWSTEQSSSGPVFVNEISKEKWSASTDANGKTYFFKLDTGETAWELPQIYPTPNGDSMTRSDYSAEYRQSKSPQISRSVKTQSMYLESQLSFTGPHGGNPTFTRTLPAGATQQPPGVLPKSQTLPSNLSTPDQNRSPAHQPQSHQQIEKINGTLKKKMIVEGGKPVKKTTSSSFVRVLGTNMVFYKDRKSSNAQQGQQHGKPDFMEPLHGAFVEKHQNKKNVLYFTTCNKNMYQLQLEDEKDMLTWLSTLQLVINELGPSNVDIKQQIEIPPAKSRRTPSFRGARNASVSEDQQNIRGRLYKLISKRPQKEVLEEKQIIKYCVFGAHLKQICDKEKVKVPKFVQRCVAAIERRGLDQDGLFRISGNLAQITKLRNMVDQDSYDLDNEQMWDIHVLTGALKLFFRELKEPLFVYAVFDKFISAICKKSVSEKTKSIKEGINSLPKVNYETLKFLCIHLLKVADSKESRMSVPNLAIVFGPTLIWKEGDSNFMAHMILQSQVIEFILLEFKTLFK